MNRSIADWKATLSALIVARVPGQNTVTVAGLLDSYLSGSGGWTPDDVGDPTGPGVPTSGDTDEEVVDQIVVSIYERAYEFRGTATVDITYFGYRNLPSGESESEVEAAISSSITATITDQIESHTPFVVTDVALTGGTIQKIGQPTTDMLVDVHEEVVAAESELSLLAAALSYLRTHYNLDTTWNVVSSVISTDVNIPVFVVVKKYTSTSFDELDATTERTYTVMVETKRRRVNGVSVLGE